MEILFDDYTSDLQPVLRNVSKQLSSPALVTNISEVPHELVLACILVTSLTSTNDLVSYCLQLPFQPILGSTSRLGPSFAFCGDHFTTTDNTPHSLQVGYTFWLYTFLKCVHTNDYDLHGVIYLEMVHFCFIYI